ncbi:hypothetical protein NVP1161O_041 [Vibrio phage 1.161.O._10N.261.48.C5]|nr:hypothetical protein NVP1161O_041 [Vibrio phage 1.161.O._10N.261.48.C5]
MKNKFEEIMQSLIECFNLNGRSETHSEDLECHECDGVATCPNKPSEGVEEELEQNMLLRDLGRGGEG